MIFHLKAAQNFIAVHEEGDFELIFQFKTAQNVVRRHYESDFNMIFHLKLETAQNLVRQQHERDFHMIFHFKKSRKISRRTALWRKFWHKNSSLWRLKSGLQSTKKEILTWFSTLRQLKTSLQSAME